MSMLQGKKLNSNDMKIYDRFPQLSCTDPQFKGSNFTNRVLYQQRQGSNKSRRRIMYYCPAYLRLQTRNFANMQFEDLVAGVNTIIILTINFRGLSPVLQQKIRSLLTLGFNRDDSIRVKQNSKQMRMNTIKSGVYTYYIQKLIHIAMRPSIQLSPLQKIDLIMSICLKSIQLNKKIIEEVRKEIETRQYFLKLQIQQSQKLLKQYQKKPILQLKGQIQKNKFQLQQKKDELECLSHEQDFLCKIDSIEVHFNLMDSVLDHIKISYTAEGSFSNYDVIQSQMTAEYTDKDVTNLIYQRYQRRLQKKKQSSLVQKQTSIQLQQGRMDHSIIRPFNYAHFKIPLYKNPVVAMITIFLPLWLLSVIMLGIYFQDSALSNRLNNLSVLQIAYIALVGVIRQQLPQSPKVTLIQGFVYLQIFAGILLFIQSIIIQGTPDYKLVWTENVFYLISVAILCFEVFSVMVMMSYYILRVRTKFARKFHKEQKFNYLKWSNAACDKVFRRRIDNAMIKVATVDKNVQQIKKQMIPISDIKSRIKQAQEKEKEEKEKHQAKDFITAIYSVMQNQNQKKK